MSELTIDRIIRDRARITPARIAIERARRPIDRMLAVK